MLEHTPARCCCTRASCVCTDSLQSGRRRRRRGDTWGRRTPAPALPAPRSHAVAVAQLAVGVPAPGVHAARLVHRDAAASQEGGGRRAAAYDQGRAAAGGGSREVGEAERGGSGGQADGPTRVAALGRARAGQAEPAPASTTHPPPPPPLLLANSPPPTSTSIPPQANTRDPLSAAVHPPMPPAARHLRHLDPLQPLGLGGGVPVLGLTVDDVAVPPPPPPKHLALVGGAHRVLRAAGHAHHTLALGRESGGQAQGGRVGSAGAGRRCGGCDAGAERGAAPPPAPPSTCCSRQYPRCAATPRANHTCLPARPPRPPSCLAPAAPSPAAAKGCPGCCPAPAGRSGSAQRRTAPRCRLPPPCGCRRKPPRPPRGPTAPAAAPG